VTGFLSVGGHLAGRGVPPHLACFDSRYGYAEALRDSLGGVIVNPAFAAPDRGLAVLMKRLLPRVSAAPLASGAARATARIVHVSRDWEAESSRSY